MPTRDPFWISVSVQQRHFSRALSKRAPAIVMTALAVSLIGSWINGPTILANALAVVVAGLALILLASRRPNHKSTASDEADPRRSWIAYELAGGGTPAGHYLLGFFGVVTIVLTGFDSPYSMLAWAALALGVSWGIVNASYPIDEG